MTLGDIIKKYRTEHKMSMDVFAERSNMSKAYISLLEKNKHPKTGKPIAPSIQVIKQSADAMNMDFNTLFEMIDSEVSLSPSLDNKSEKDIAKKMHLILNSLEHENGLMFDGEPLDDESKDLLKASLENSLRVGKAIAKQKYTPKKYKKNE